MKTNIHFFIISRSDLIRKRNVSGKGCRGNQNTNFMFSNFFYDIVSLLENVEKCVTAGKATDDNMTHAH